MSIIIRQGPSGNDKDCGEMDSEEKDTSPYFARKKRSKRRHIESPMVSSPTANRLQTAFYSSPCVSLAKSLLGKFLVRQLDDGIKIRGRIVETESYLGGEDQASQSFGGKQTPRNEPMFMKPGTAFVYMTYGMYYCFNISSEGEGAAVLLRAAEPLDSLDEMRKFRGVRRKDNGTNIKIVELCNGPSKLCQAFHITKDLINKQDLTVSPSLWLEDGDEVEEGTIVATSRIGIGPRAGEWAKKPLRFYIGKNVYVSHRDKAAERNQFPD